MIALDALARRRSQDELDPPRRALHRRSPARLTSCVPTADSDGELPPVQVDPDRLGEVLANLL
jgi:hypothetical protein